MATTDATKKHFIVDSPLALSDEGVQHNSRFLLRRKSMLSAAENAKSRPTHIPQHNPSDSTSSDEILDPRSSARRQSLTRDTLSSKAKVVPNEIKRRKSMMNLSNTTTSPLAPQPQPTGSMSVLKTSLFLTGDNTAIAPAPRRASLLHPPSRRSTMPALPVPPLSPRPATKQNQAAVHNSRPTPLLNTRLLDSSQTTLRRRGSVQNLESTMAAASTVESNIHQPGRCRHESNNKEPYQPIWLRRQTKCAACNPNPIPQPPPQQQQQQQQQQPPTSPTAPGNVSPPLTVVTTAATAMAAAAAVVSAAAATAASLGTAKVQHNLKWAGLITDCVTHSRRLEKLAQEILSQESSTDQIATLQQSLEDVQNAREEAHQQKIKECVSLVKTQRSMLLEFEGLLAEFGLSSSGPTTPSTEATVDTQDGDDGEEEYTTTTSTTTKGSTGKTALFTPPQSAFSASFSLPSMPPSPTTSYENGYGSIKSVAASPELIISSRVASPRLSQQERAASPLETAAAELAQKLDESVSRVRWTVSQWIGGLVGNGQCVKDDGYSMVVSGKAFTKEPTLLPLHLAGPLTSSSSSTQSKSVHYHQYVLKIMPDDRKSRLALLPYAQWTPDDHVSCCEFANTDDKVSKCLAKFDWTARRHHCRRCGHIFCNAHSSNQLPLFDSADRKSKPDWSRVCDSCFYTVAGPSLFHPADQPSLQYI